MAFLLAFGVISLSLACVGIFGLVSYSVNERVREIGIRIALGAGVRDVRGLVLRQTLAVVGAGVVIGLAGAAAASGALRALVYGVTPTDPVTLGFVAILLPAVGVIAAALPMRRATRIDPVEALRS
jgi:ABC-type antimicrobial peptide transport system permease subunit